MLKKESVPVGDVDIIVNSIETQKVSGFVVVNCREWKEVIFMDGMMEDIFHQRLKPKFTQIALHAIVGFLNDLSVWWSWLSSLSLCLCPVSTC